MSRLRSKPTHPSPGGVFCAREPLSRRRENARIVRPMAGKRRNPAGLGPTGFPLRARRNTESLAVLLCAKDDTRARPGHGRHLRCKRHNQPQPAQPSSILFPFDTLCSCPYACCRIQAWPHVANSPNPSQHRPRRMLESPGLPTTIPSTGLFSPRLRSRSLLALGVGTCGTPSTCSSPRATHGTGWLTTCGRLKMRYARPRLSFSLPHFLTGR